MAHTAMIFAMIDNFFNNGCMPYCGDEGRTGGDGEKNEAIPGAASGVQILRVGARPINEGGGFSMYKFRKDKWRKNWAVFCTPRLFPPPPTGKIVIRRDGMST